MKNLYPAIVICFLLAPFFSWAQPPQECLTLEMEQVSAAPGDTVCLDVRVRSFNDILSLQYSMQWDPAQLEFLEVNNFQLAGLNASSFGLNTDLQARGKVGFSWFDLTTLTGQTLTDGSVLYSICFRVNTNSGATATIRFGDDPTPPEVTYADETFGEIPIVVHGQVTTINRQATTPLGLEAACLSAAACEEGGGTITVTVQNGLPPYAFSWSGPGSFTSSQKDLSGLAGGVYQLTVTDSEGTGLQADFNVPAGSDGLSAGINIVCLGENAANTQLVAGVFGGLAPFSFAWSNGQTVTDSVSSSIEVPIDGVYSVTVTDQSGCSFIADDIKPASTCVNTQTQAFLKIDDQTVQTGDTFEVPVKLNTLAKLSQLGFSIQWDIATLELTDILLGDDLPQLTENNLKYDAVNAPGQLGFQWSALEAIQLMDNNIVLRLRFVARGTTNTSINFSDAPVVRLAMGAMQTPVNLVTEGAAIFFGKYPVVKITIPSAQATLGSEVCIPVLAEGIKDLVGLQFSLQWDTSSLHFERVQAFGLPDFSSSNFGVQNTDAGRLVVSWLDNSLQGQSIPDQSALFEICFTAGLQEDTTAVYVDTSSVPVEFIHKDIVNLDFILQPGIVTTNFQVWPGDTDLDGTVNHFDLLNLGLGFGRSGPVRPEASIDWRGQFSTPWQQSTPNSQIDYRFSDTNGNGVIEATDTSAILRNYGRTYLPVPPGVLPESSIRSTGTPLFVEVDTLTINTPIELPIIFGTEEEPATETYGLAFSISYDPDAVVPGSVNVDFEGSWLGPTDSLLTIFKEHPASGRLDVAVTRIDGRNLSGQGVLGRLFITIEDVIFEVRDKETFKLEVQNVQVINASEELLIVNPQTSEAVLSNTPTSLPVLLDNRRVQLFPVPVGDELRILAPDLQVEQLELFNLRGQKLQQHTGAPSEIHLQNIPRGQYILKFICPEGVLIKQFVKQ